MQIIEIRLEIRRQLYDRFQVGVCDDDLPLLVLLCVIFGQSDSRLERYDVESALELIVRRVVLYRKPLTISYFAPIPLNRTHLISAYVLLGVYVEANVVATLACQLVHERLPHELSLVVGKLGIEELDVDARDESIVKGTHAICGEEQDTIVVLESSEEA